MYLILIEYKVPFEQVEPHVDAHIKFVRRYVDIHKFVLTGRKVPRTGGVLLGDFASREEVEKTLNEDPFRIHDLANFEIIEIELSQVSEKLFQK